MDVKALHHVSLPVTDLERSRRFYREVLGLEEIARPPIPVPGAWFRLGDRELHLVAGGAAAVRGADGHGPAPAPLRRPGRQLPGALEHLRGHGYREDADEGDPRARAGAAPVGGGLPAALPPRPRPAPDRDQRREARRLSFAFQLSAGRPRDLSLLPRPGLACPAVVVGIVVRPVAGLTAASWRQADRTAELQPRAADMCFHVIISARMRLEDVRDQARLRGARPWRPRRTAQRNSSDVRNVLGRQAIGVRVAIRAVASSAGR